MAAPWLNRAVYQLPRNGTTTHTVDPTSATNLVSGSAFTPTSGRLLVAVIEGAVTSTTPSGWTLPSGGSAVNLTGLYVWWRSAAAGSNAFTTTHNASNYPVVVSIYEFPAGSTFVKSVAATGLAYNAANPALTALTGTNTVMAVKARTVPDSDAYAFTWTGTGTPVEDWDLRAAFATTDGYVASLAYVDGFTGTSWQPTASNAVTSGSHEALTFAINVASAPVTTKGGFAGTYRFGAAAASGRRASVGQFAGGYGFGPAATSGASAHAGGFTAAYGFGPALADGSARPQAGFAAGYAFGPAQGGGEAPSGGTFAGGWAYGPARFAGGGHVAGGFAGAYGFGPAGFGGASPDGGGFATAHAWGPADAAGAVGASGGFAGTYTRGPALVGGAADYAGGFAAAHAWGPAQFGGTPDEFCWPSMLLVPLGDGTSLVGADVGSTLVPESTPWTLVEDGCRP
jgi:hypothetical protein